MKYLKYGNLYPIDRFSLSGERVGSFYVSAKKYESMLIKIADDCEYYLNISGDSIYIDNIGNKNVLRKFMDAFRKDALEKAEMSWTSATSLRDSGVAKLEDDFYFEAEEFKREFIEQKQYDPQEVYKLFVAAKENPKYYDLYPHDSPCDHAHEKKPIYSQMISEFVAGGGDIETIRYMLNKHIKMGEEYIEKNPDKDGVDSRVLESLDSLYLSALEMDSPYDKIFNFSTSIVREQKKLGELAQDPNTSQEMLDKMEAQIYEMQNALEKEMSKCDPEMLMQVAESRKKNINLDAENEKGITNYSKSQVEALKGVTQIQQIAKRQIQRERDAEADRGY